MIEDNVILGILTIVLAVVGAIIAAFCIIAYELLSKAVTVRARSESKEVMRKLGANLLINMGYIYWEDYKISRREEYLNMAIDVTEDAYNDFAKFLKEFTNEDLICTLKNNLAYYYAERARIEDGVKARQYAEYILNKSHKYDSPFRDKIIDTYQYVQQRFPKSQLDIYLKKPFLLNSLRKLLRP